MKFFKNTSLVLILIIVLASFLRLPLLNQYPVGVTGDPAGQAYSAYSILKTGADEWGDFLPINPRGFGDYKPPLFMYLLVPSIAVFGLTEYAIRLPSAIAGILTVLVMFYLVKRLFNNRTLGLIASFLLAISPWHVYYSRLGWESNIGLLFFITGIWLFIKGLEKTKLLSLSVLSFGLAGMSYHSFKLLVPLIFIALIIIFWKQFRSINKKSLIAPLAVTTIFVLVLGYGLIFAGASRRAADQSILKEENLSVLRQNQVEDGLPQPFNRVVFNKYQFFISKVSDNYLGYYSLSFLFGPHRSDGSILNFPSMGLLYIWQLPLILFGLFYLIKNKSKGSAVVFAWTLLAPIPASLTQDYMHAGRAQALFPALTIISAIGLYSIFEFIKNPKYQNAFKIVTTLVIVLSVLWRIDNYLFHTFNKNLGGLQPGYKEVINFTESNKNLYDKIIFTKHGSEPHAFVSFYASIDPREVQYESQDWKRFETEGLRFLDMIDYKLGKYHFKNVDFNRDRNEVNALLVAPPKDIPSDIIPIFEAKDSNGKVMFVVIDTNEIPK